MPSSTIEIIGKIFRRSKNCLKLESANEKPTTIVKEFCLNTSAHGLAGIARSRHFCNCLFWTLPTFTFMGIMILLIVEAIQNYYQYPTQTSVEIIAEWPIAFPAVTICNRAAIRFDKIMPAFLNYTNATEYTPELASYMFSFLKDSEIESNFSGEYFFPLSSMLIGCTYNGVACSTKNFTVLAVRQYGLCYTFNAKLKSVPDGGIHYTSDYGSMGELNMEFYVHRHQYVPYLQRGEGMVAMLHDNDRMPSLATGAILLGTQRHHRWNYRNRAFTFLPKPFTSCSSESNLAMQTLFDQYQTNEYRYSTNVCFDICVQTYIYDKCGCVSPDLWHIRSVVLPGTTKVIRAELCDDHDMCFINRSKEFVQNTKIWEFYCNDCGEECNYTEFVIQSSSMGVTLDYDLSRIKDFVERSNVTLPESWSDIYETEIPKNYVSFEIITQSSRVETYNQQRAIDLGQLISNVGGQTGLWIGVSFLSLFELIEMIARLVIACCRIIQRRFQQQEKTDVIPVQF